MAEFVQEVLVALERLADVVRDVHFIDLALQNGHIDLHAAEGQGLAQHADDHVAFDDVEGDVVIVARRQQHLRHAFARNVDVGVLENDVHVQPIAVGRHERNDVVVRGVDDVIDLENGRLVRRHSQQFAAFTEPIIKISILHNV
ncbi:hypothetical protein [Cynomolgus macaque cytomegalovirus strain Mauritius]|uniref:Uncharacterized protein n=1 Tax=Cynomolgus macaque cytomegalovirus strain Mauritius TaxID=1690255 RepID=A0A0K1H019_9BETA|nr:hypothetical protein [Cynomolgus macaque cytomegalovirus strain Mauritius]AXG21781.1 hypothetical protein [synthetic construct]AXG22049.1 hypothetical protein [synthetic construct]